MVDGARRQSPVMKTAQSICHPLLAICVHNSPHSAIASPRALDTACTTSDVVILDILLSLCAALYACHAACSSSFALAPSFSTARSVPCAAHPPNTYLSFVCNMRSSRTAAARSVGSDDAPTNSSIDTPRHRLHGCVGGNNRSFLATAAGLSSSGRCCSQAVKTWWSRSVLSVGGRARNTLTSWR